MRSFTALVTLLIVLGISAIPCSVEAGSSIKIAASKDATLYIDYRGFCSGTTDRSCTGLYSTCPWCNAGKASTLTVEAYELQAISVVGFTLKKIRGRNVKSCKITFPKPTGPSPPGLTQVEVTDVSFKWREKEVTYESKPATTAVGSYGRFDPFTGKSVDVTKGCKAAFANRAASGNGLAVSLKINNTGNADAAVPNYIVELPSREAMKAAILKISYY
eukprot:TRINITY_DN11146_c0_g1_i1.p1 TRINITY_DN11146_c0_g1~~TRINITY_DN11146_c0_g1_i1.p1  ORF type:complete len:218 (-),score=29.97 TRINITY_DN11146_c0_g1_i1:291-944(-)